MTCRSLLSGQSFVVELDAVLVEVDYILAHDHDRDHDRDTLPAPPLFADPYSEDD